MGVCHPRELVNVGADLASFGEQPGELLAIHQRHSRSARGAQTPGPDEIGHRVEAAGFFGGAKLMQFLRCAAHGEKLLALPILRATAHWASLTARGIKRESAASPFASGICRTSAKRGYTGAWLATTLSSKGQLLREVRN